MNFKQYLRILYVPAFQVVALMNLAKWLRRLPVVGKVLAVLIDNLILYFFSLEVTSESLNVNKLIIGHSTGVVLGGNGIKCSGALHVSSGVVFGGRYQDKTLDNTSAFFEIEGDLTIGANSVLLGPLFIKGPTIIGALSIVTKDILEPGVYVGSPARKIRDL
ncbi:hypothetical protein OAD36_04770 [Gammaproteobacteria bacterium]|nr:hypothetical protein [Gammaproteobacteria bacterium]